MHWAKDVSSETHAKTDLFEYLAVVFLMKKVDELAFEERPVPKKEDLKANEYV